MQVGPGLKGQVSHVENLVSSASLEDVGLISLRKLSSFLQTREGKSAKKDLVLALL